MEFFASTSAQLGEAQLHDTLTIGRLPEFCRAIDQVIQWQNNAGEIYCLWGQFRVHRELIRGGVRFTLPGCPNALAWTITTNSEEFQGMVIHCTIHRTTHDPDFIESIEQFVEDWRQGLERLANQGRCANG